jgi:D-xylose transport system ATP-binding protein
MLNDISFAVRGGEVLGIGGLMGAGRSELLLHLFGAWGFRLSGDVRIAGERIPTASVSESVRRGMVMVTEDRKRFGLIVQQPVGFNLSLSSLHRVTRRGMIRPEEESRVNAGWIERLGIDAPGQDFAVRDLSGGNQQKVVLGKALMTEPRVILLDEPTRGIDVGAKREIAELIGRLTRDGKAVVLVSSELPELTGLSDRILMLHEGAVTGEFERGQFDPERLLAAALGHRESPEGRP